MAEAVQEFVDSRGLSLRVDRDGGVLRGVKLIGLESRNGRRYRPAALEQAAPLYEAAKVNVNHPKGGPLSPRDYQDRLGVIRDVQFRTGEGLFGDLHFNPKHALAEQLSWDAEHNPRNVGFSHNVLARLSREGDATVVEEITRVQSIDLVADPAATAGLFEQQGDDPVEPIPAAWDALTLATLEVHRPDLLDEIRRQQAARTEQRLEAAEEESRGARRRLAIAEALAKRGVAGPATESQQRALLGAAFWDALAEADDARFDALLAERVASLPSGALPPRSVEQRLGQGARETVVVDAAEFARAIRR